jgi:hypothetical protein
MQHRREYKFSGSSRSRLKYHIIKVIKRHQGSQNTGNKQAGFKEEIVTRQTARFFLRAYTKHIFQMKSALEGDPLATFTRSLALPADKPDRFRRTKCATFFERKLLYLSSSWNAHLR